MERFASRDLGLSWKINVLTGAEMSCATLTYRALRKRTSVNLDIATALITWCPRYAWSFPSFSMPIALVSRQP
jgi:hypothetical protein